VDNIYGYGGQPTRSHQQQQQQQQQYRFGADALAASSPSWSRPSSPAYINGDVYPGGPASGHESRLAAPGSFGGGVAAGLASGNLGILGPDLGAADDPYLAPEVASRASAPTSRSDAYAIAALLSFALTRTAPTRPLAVADDSGATYVVLWIFFFFFFFFSFPFSFDFLFLPDIFGLKCSRNPRSGFANLEHVVEQVAMRRPEIDDVLDLMLGAVAAAGFDFIGSVGGGQGKKGRKKEKKPAYATTESQR
jgi:hypothetical protein